MSSERTNQWPEILLRDLIERNYSGPSPTCEERNIGNSDEWGLLKTTAITWPGWNEDAHKVPPKTYWNNPSIEVQPDDVLVTKAGPRHRVGVVVHVRGTRPHLMVSGKMIGLRPRTEKIIPSILAGLLSTREPQDFLNSRTTGMAESQTNFADDALLQTPLRVPPLVEQRRIAEVLDTLDDQIRATEQVVSKLELACHGLQDRILTLGTGLQPTQWRTVRIADITQSLVDGPFGSNLKTEHYQNEPGVRVVRLQNIEVGRFLDLDKAYISHKHAETLADHDVRANDILVASLGDDKRPYGRACLYPPWLAPGIVKADCFRFRVNRSLCAPLFVASALNSEKCKRQIRAQGQGVTRDRINLSILRSVEIPLPPLDEQNAIAEVIESSRAILEGKQLKLRKLRILKQGLMTDLLTGRVRVPVEAGS